MSTRHQSPARQTHVRYVDIPPKCASHNVIKIEDTVWPSLSQDISSMKNQKCEPQSRGFYVLQD